jgi:hypothetical protein
MGIKIVKSYAFHYFGVPVDEKHRLFVAVFTFLVGDGTAGLAGGLA